uniref:Uncharacterized protein n=1 Tax=Candidatus Kentrum eta TaxID=2126337 RepID=A0A450V5Z8_9GAMM|nr:MAG: hypothetical protein BECKH772A_GA0070896_100926 [Candidatus Kentron sp. H]VFK00208.1 MAG: hypothetical protein BECKH772B_GA0070898_101826 [Candidatus Kentron sp. H]VFK04447.1 MAG: hypothetical protein BECKH772C_GA0070978_101826 [Candidatus Kentron sp. H]
MWKDPIVEEIHEYRDEYARQFNDDLHAICQDLREKQGQDVKTCCFLEPQARKKMGFQRATPGPQSID